MKKSTSFAVARVLTRLASRERAQWVVAEAIRNGATSISLRGARTASRSFLDELYADAKKHGLPIMYVPLQLSPLFELVVRSRQSGRAIAPEFHPERRRTLTLKI